MREIGEQKGKRDRLRHPRLRDKLMALLSPLTIVGSAYTPLRASNAPTAYCK